MPTRRNVCVQENKNEQTRLNFSSPTQKTKRKQPLQVSAESVVAAVTPNTVLVSIMHSNNEVGTINPIAEIAEALKGVTRAEGQPGVVFHSDTSQSLGKVKIDAKALGVDYLTVTGKKKAFGRSCCCCCYCGGASIAAAIVRRNVKDYFLFPITQEEAVQ